MKINRTVNYVTAGGRIRPAIITAIAGTVATVRVGRHGETYAGIALMTSPVQANRWYPGSRRRYVV